jgi:hypothetical protein
VRENWSVPFLESRTAVFVPKGAALEEVKLILEKTWGAVELPVPPSGFPALHQNTTGILPVGSAVSLCILCKITKNASLSLTT